MENQRLKDENIKLRQQGKGKVTIFTIRYARWVIVIHYLLFFIPFLFSLDIKEHGRLLTDRIVKATQETLKGIEENRKLKDEIKGSKIFCGPFEFSFFFALDQY